MEYLRRAVYIKSYDDKVCIGNGHKKENHFRNPWKINGMDQEITCESSSKIFQGVESNTVIKQVYENTDRKVLSKKRWNLLFERKTP